MSVGQLPSRLGASRLHRRRTAARDAAKGRSDKLEAKGDAQELKGNVQVGIGKVQDAAKAVNKAL